GAGRSRVVTRGGETWSHYMFCFARDFRVGDPETSKLLFEGSKATFLEDAEMLEAVQANRHGGSLEGLIDIAADAAQLQARRMLDQLIAAERVERPEQVA